MDVAGSFLSRRNATHTYDLGLSYSTQEYAGRQSRRAGRGEGRQPQRRRGLRVRQLGGLAATDRDYGGRYARYDYLAERGLLSPRAGITLEPVKSTRIKAVARAAHGGARGRGIPLARRDRALAAAGAHLRAARCGETCCESSARATSTSLVEHEFKDAYVHRRPPLLPGRRRSAGHALRSEPAGRAAIGRPLLRGERRQRRRRRLGVRAEQPVRQAACVRRSTTASRTRAGRTRQRRASRAVGAGGHSSRVGRHSRLTTSVETDIPENGDACVPALQAQLGIHAHEPHAAGAGSRRPLRRAGQPGAALRLGRHAVGSAGRASEPVPRSAATRRRSTTSCSWSGRRSV